MYTPTQIINIVDDDTVTQELVTKYITCWNNQGHHYEAKFLQWQWQQRAQWNLKKVLRTTTHLPQTLIDIVVYLSTAASLSSSTYDHHHYVHYPIRYSPWYPLSTRLSKLSTTLFLEQLLVTWRTIILSSVDFVHALWSFEISHPCVHAYLRQFAISTLRTRNTIGCLHMNHVIDTAVKHGTVAIVAILVNYVNNWSETLPRVLERALHCSNMHIVNWVLDMLSSSILLPSALVIYFVRMCSISQIQKLVTVYPTEQCRLSDIAGTVLPLILASAADCGRYSVLSTLARQSTLWAFTTTQYNTPLHCAARRGFDVCVVFLLTLTACDIRTEVYCRTPLYIATSRGNLHTMVLLLEACADVNAQSCYGETALSVATYTHCVPAVRLLLKHRANPHLVDTEGDTVLETYCKSPSRLFNFDILHLLLKYGAIPPKDTLDSDPFLTLVSKSLHSYKDPKHSLIHSV